MFTANSMNCLYEALGIALPGNGTVLDINQYCAWSGREYIMGEAWFSEEESGLFLMTRGQK